MSVGRKIQTLRKKRGITQNVLSENIVSRSMLSRIESGSAEPSMATLLAIAERLDVSPSFLLEEDEDLLPAERAFYAKQIFENLSTGNYRECLEIFDQTDLNKSDLNGIYAHCAFSVGYEDFLAGNFQNAKKLLSAVSEIAPSLTTPVPVVSKERTSLLLRIIENISNLDKVQEQFSDSPDFTFQPSLFLFLLRLLHQNKINECGVFMEYCHLDSHYFDFLKAQILIKDYKFIDALLLLKNLTGRDNVPFFLRLLCYRSVEECCKLCEDYKGAYENHLLFSRLLEKIK